MNVRIVAAALIKKNVQKPRVTDGWSFREYLLINDVNPMRI